MNAHATIARQQSDSVDAHWAAIVADYRAKHAAWLVTLRGEDEAETAFHAAQAAGPAKPTEPPSSMTDDMTIREIRALSHTLEHKAAWAAYERNLAAWKEENEALRRSIVGAADTAWRKGFAAYDAALSRLRTYPVKSLGALAEKVQIGEVEYRDDGVPGEWLSAILADVRRLDGERTS